MATAELELPSMRMGDNFTRDEFMRLWEMSPRIKRAELIRGVVYMPSPLSVEHGGFESSVGGWVFNYMVATPGLASEHNATTFLLADVPQPDINLRILPECGGKTAIVGKYLSGPPELLVEICFTSAAYDLHQKFDLYEEAGVQEYLAIVLGEKQIRWYTLEDSRYEVMQPEEDGVHRSRVFPGLWLHSAGLFNADMGQLMACLHEGIASAEHGDFVRELAARRGAQA